MRDMKQWRAKSARRLLETAQRMATREDKELKTCQIRNSLEDISIHVDGYSEPGYDADVVATGNWNNPKLSDLPERLSKAFERIGIEIEWVDEWTTCDGCQGLVRTSPDGYSWQPSYVIVAECDTFCKRCFLADEGAVGEYLEDKEGNPDTAVNLDGIDLSEYGYVLVQDRFENGLHRGMDASPEKIAKTLERLGFERFLFEIAENSQFYSTFSVWVHEEEGERLEILKSILGDEPLSAEDSDGPSVSAAMEAGLKAAAELTDNMKGEGIKYVNIGMNEDGTPKVEGRVISREEFIEKGFKKEAD